MKRVFIIFLLSLPFFIKAQNLPQCDSLVISCCVFDSLGSNTISIYVANPSSELFDYPGFILLDGNMDTIAKETVNYFGIGVWPQAHTMTFLAPLTLPFSGTLELHTLFYQEFACIFPFTIADTATAVLEMPLEESYVVFPNPCAGELQVMQPNGSGNNEVVFSIMDISGREVLRENHAKLPVTMFLDGLQPGLYILRIANSNDQLLQFQKVIVVE